MQLKKFRYLFFSENKFKELLLLKILLYTLSAFINLLLLYDNSSNNILFLF